MRVQYNELNQVIGHGEIYGEMTAEVEPIEGNYFDYDYINGQLVRMRWSDWHEDTNFQIKFHPIDLLELIKDVPAMIDYVNTLTVYSDEFGNQYLYVNYFVDMERELIEYYGATITERTEI